MCPTLIEHTSQYPGPGPSADDFDPKKHVWDGNVWWTFDHAHFWDGRRWRSASDPSEPEPSQATSLERAPLPRQSSSAVEQASVVSTVGPRPIVQITVSAGTAFKIGFFGVIGGVLASAIFWVVLIVFFGSCLAALRPAGT